MAYLNYENKRGSGKKLKVHFDLPEDDDCHMPNQKGSRSSSVSSKSSLDSDYNDKDDENVDSKYCAYGSPVWSFQGGSVTQSPPTQFMTSPGYDPNRIPSSVFANRPTSPMEWSVASNESLFSIHLGNNSFSRDQTLAYSKSGELPRTNNNNNNNEIVGMQATLPTVQEVNSTDEKNVDMERHSVSSDSSNDSDEGHDQKKTTSHEKMGSTVEVQNKKTETSTEAETPVMGHSKEATVLSEEPKNIASVSYRSVESDRSFQFPILTADGGGRTSSSTVESEKQEKSEKQEEQQQPAEKPVQPPKAEKSPSKQKQSSRNWCFCSCSPCY